MEKLNFFEKQSNDYFYNEMYKMYNELNDMVISQLDENDILYNFKARILKIKGMSNLSIEELKAIENVIYKNNGIVRNSTLDFGGEING